MVNDKQGADSPVLTVRGDFVQGNSSSQKGFQSILNCFESETWHLRKTNLLFKKGILMQVRGHATPLVCPYVHLPTQPCWALLLLFAEFKQLFSGLVFQFCNMAAVRVGLWEYPTILSAVPLRLVAASALRCSQLCQWLWCNFTGLQPSSVT